MRRGFVGLAVVLLATVGAVVVVQWLRVTAPTTSLPPEAVVAEPDPATVLDCALLDGPADDRPPAPARVRSGEVLACPVAMDRQRVTYVGEVVGEVLRRDGGSWVLANDDPYALTDGPLALGGEVAGTNSGLTLWLPAPLDELVTTPGRAGLRGDVVEVVGTVHRADPQDGGGLTIRAEEVELVAGSAELVHPLHWRQTLVAVLVGLAAAGSLLQELRARRDRRRPT